MHLSPYLLAFPSPEGDGRLLLYSTRRGSRLRVTPEAWERIQAGRVSVVEGEALARAGVLTEDPGAERRQVLGYLDEVNRADPGVTAAVYLGLACNFACPYCYERPLGRDGAMTEAIADRLCAFLLDRVDRHARQAPQDRRGPGKARLTVDFYGGEPLLYRPLLRRIAGALRAGVAARDAEFRFTLVTNGSLLTRPAVAELLPLGLASAKVTLDGPPETHDRTRPLRSGRGSFRAILRNLREVAGHVPLGIGGNYTRENWRAFPGLLDRLQAEGLGPDRVAQVQFAPVVGALACGGCVSSADPWMAEAAATLRAETLRRGYRVPRLTPAPCMVDLDAAFSVHWDGALYKCPALVGRPEFAAGDLGAGPGDHGPAHGGERWQNREECRACAYLPLCFGGCRYLALERTGTPASLDCQRPFLDAFLPAALPNEPPHPAGS